MLIRNPNQNDFFNTDEDSLYTPIELDEYSDYDEMDERFIPPIFNNPSNIFGPPGGPGGFPGGGPGGFPGGPPGGPGGGPGGPGGGPGGPPGPPPSKSPNKPPQAKAGFGGPQTFAVSPGSIRPCRFQYVYIWLTNGRSFWAWLINVDRRTAYGWRWNGFRWVYFGVDLRRVEFFECFGRNEERQMGPSSNPPGPPPSKTPSKPNEGISMYGAPSTKAVSPGSIKPCLYQYVYLWLTNGRSFWAWLVNVDKKTASGFRWDGRRWVYFGVDLKSIEYFECYGRCEERQMSPPSNPPGPPPSNIPAKPMQAKSGSGGPQTFTVSETSIRRCLYQFVYLWLSNGRSFWAWLFHVDRVSASGFRWDGRRWVLFGVSLRQIEFFECSGRCDEERQMSPPSNPPGPPPSNVPAKPMQAKSGPGGPQTFTVSQTSIRRCLYQFVYLWLSNGRSFWAWLFHVDRVSASGFRWDGRRWVLFGVSLRQIEFFECSGRDCFREMDNTEMYDSEFEDTNMNETNIKDTEPIDTEMFLHNQSIKPDKFKIDYPYFKGMPNKEVETILNETIVSEVTSLLSQGILVPGQDNVEEVVIAYQVPLNENGLISIVFSIYTFSGGANGTTIFSSLTMNTTTGEVYEFDDLFKPNSEYRKMLSDIAMRMAEEKDVQFINKYTGITDNQQFYLTPNGIVLFYQPLEFTPHYYGLFRIMIPYSEIQSVLNTENPVTKFSTNSPEM